MESDWQSKLGLNKAVTTDYTTALEDLERKKALAAQEKDYDVLDQVQKTIDRYKILNL